MKIEKYDVKDAGKVYIWALILPVIVSLIIGFALSGSAKDESGKFIIFQEAWFNYVLQILSVSLLLGLFFIYTKKSNISFKACGITKKPHYLMVIICVVVGISLCFFTDQFITIIAMGLHAIGININSSMNIPLSNFGEYTLAIVLIAIMPAICEELIYRGIILNGLRKYGKWPAILLSALAFCLMHGNIAQFPYTFLLGIVLGYVMFETSSLILCITIHFFNNATVLTQMYVTQSSTIPETLTASYIIEAIVFLLVAVSIVILAFYLLAKIKNKFEKPETISLENTPQEEEKANEIRKRNKEKRLLTKNQKFEKPEQVVIPELEQPKKLENGLVMLIVGYGIALLITMIGLI